MFRHRFSADKGEVAVAAFILAISAAFVVAALFYPPQSRFFPLGAGLFTAAACLVAALGRAGEDASPAGLGDGAWSRDGLRKATVFALLPLYLLGALTLGMTLTTVLFVAAYLRIMPPGQMAVHKALAAGAIVAATLYLLFDEILRIPLYRGTLGML